MGQLEQILNNTENIMHYLNLNQASWTDWIPVIAAVVALFGIRYSTRYVKNNIRMSARIEWIQRVRETTAEVVSLCYSLVYEIDEDKAQCILLKAQEKVNLLILYFGPDEVKKIVFEDSSVILKDENSNEGKNNYIVKFLERLLNVIEKYYKRKYSSKVQMLTFEIKALKKSYSLEKTGERYLDEEGNYIDVKDYPMEYYEKKKELEKEKNELQNSSEVLSSINELRENLRIYLKVEWKETEKGK